MNLIQLLRYLFAARPGPGFQYTKLTLAAVALLVVAGIAIRVARSKWVKDEIIKKMIKRYPSHLYSFAIALAMLLLFREAGVPLLSMRIWWVGFAVLLLIWVIKVIMGFGSQYHSRKSQHLHREALNRYLPTKRK